MQCKFAWLSSEETFFRQLHQPKTWGGWVAPVWQLCLLDTYWDSMKQGVLSTTDLACVNHLFAGPQAIKGREEFKIPIRSHRMWCKALKATRINRDSQGYRGTSRQHGRSCLSPVKRMVLLNCMMKLQEFMRMLELSLILQHSVVLCTFLHVGLPTASKRCPDL